MPTTIPAPDPLPLPAPPWLLWFLLMLTFTLHVVAMNVALGGSIIAFVTRLRRTEERDRLAQWLGALLPTVVAATITFGVAPLLFVQVLYGRLLFSSAVLMAWFWLAVVPLLILGYYGTYAIAFRRGGVVIAAAVALIFAAIGFLYSNNMTLMLRPDRFLSMYLENARGVQLNLSDPTLIPRYLHMLLGAIAVAGLVVAIYGVVVKRDWEVRYGALWFTLATSLNLVAGTWWMFALPRDVMIRFMGTNMAVTFWLGLGIGAGTVALLLMAMGVRAEEPRPYVTWGGALTAITLVAMIVSRDHVRGGMLQLAGFEPVTNIQPQWGVIALFAVLLVAALATTGWMGYALLPLAPRSGERGAVG